MKNCGRLNVRKHKDIKGSDKYVTLNISLKSDIMDKIRITSLESTVKLVGSVQWFIASLGLKAKTRQKEYKKARYVIINVIKKYLSKIIRYF